MTKDILSKKVVQSNELITGVSKMDRTPLKIFELAVACIDTENPSQKVELSKQDIFRMFKAEDKNRYGRFREHIETLSRQGITVELPNNKQARIVVTPYVEWGTDESNDSVLIKFSEEIMPYLINLKQNFTQYLIRDIAELNSKYSIILYKWLTMNYNQYERYGNMDCKNPIISVQELRKITDTVQEYKEFSNFQKWVIKKSIDEINANTHYEIVYKKIKSGRSISEIQFYISSADEGKNAAVEPRTRREAKEVNLADTALLYVEAMQDTYILELVQYGLVAMNDVQTIVRAHGELVPSYRLLDEETGGKGFKEHVERVQEYMDLTDKTHANMVAYLKTSVEQRLAQLKRED